jgi:hypothetical protein
MTLHCDYLRTLERVSQLDKPVMSTQLMGQTGQFLQRRWILEDGYLSAIPVDVLDGEDEAEVEVDVDAGTYSFHRLGGQTAKVTRPIAEITVYSFNVDAWLNDITTLFDIEPSKIARQRELIPGHLWHLGDLRVNRSSRFVPLYVSRRPKMCHSEWEQNLRDLERSSHGIVLMTDSKTSINLPNHHQVRELDALLTDVTNVVTLKGDVLDRMLRGVPDDAVDDRDRYNEITGALKLRCMAAEKTFKGETQKSVIALFWRERHQLSLKWSDVRSSTDCGKDPDSVFGKGEWQAWIERVAHGQYRLRVS